MRSAGVCVLGEIILPAAAGFPGEVAVMPARSWGLFGNRNFTMGKYLKRLPLGKAVFLVFTASANAAGTSA
jgi:hypothetical protein